MAKPSLGECQGALLRYVARHSGLSTREIVVTSGIVSTERELRRRLSRLRELGLLQHGDQGRDVATWDLTVDGWQWLATRANPYVPVPQPKRLVLGRRMRQCVAYVLRHSGCTKYAAGKAVTRSGRERDGWVIVQRCIDAGLIEQHHRRDGTFALYVTDRGLTV